MSVRPVLFIHTNAQQMVGALVGAYAAKRNASEPESFDVEILNHGDFPFFAAREGQPFLRGGGTREWANADLQSFTPLRFMPPERMGYRGRAILTDPDVFAVGDVCELFARDMGGKAIMAVARPGHNGRRDYVASSVMLLDCAKLTHWRVEAQFAEMFAMERDYLDWIQLGLEDPDAIGLLEPEWNHFDTLEPETRFIHNTKRKWQPWKTGLPVDFTTRDKKPDPIPKRWFRQIGRAFSRGSQKRNFYQPHPDPRQEALFFGLLGECLEAGGVTETFLRDEMALNHIRHDSLEMIERHRGAQPLAA